jgi:hypothetical protein
MAGDGCSGFIITKERRRGMLAQLWESIMDSFHHRFSWPARHEAKSDDYQQTPAEQRVATGVHHDARALAGHLGGNPDGGRGSGRHRHR